MRILATVAFAVATFPADAATFTLTLSETAAGVKASGSGDFDISSMTFQNNESQLQPSGEYFPAIGLFLVIDSQFLTAWSVTFEPDEIEGPMEFGLLGDGLTFMSDSSEGNGAGFNLLDGVVWTPKGYTTGPLFSEMILGETGQGFDDLGIRRGQFEFPYGNNNAHSVIVRTLETSAPPVVPLPAGLTFAMTSFAALGATAWRGRRKKTVK